MSETSTRKAKAAETSEEGVVAYLREHSDFFDHHPELLEHLTLKHASGSAVSLIERQIEVIRSRNHQLQQRLATLLETARENENRVMHLNSLARALIASTTPAEVLQGLETCLTRDFGVDALFLGIKILGDNTPETTPVKGLRYLAGEDPVLVSYENFFRMGQVECGGLAAEQANLLFPNWKKSKPLRSAALVPLGKPSTMGMLALASVDADHFQSDMGTMFLELMADLVAASLRDLFEQVPAATE